MDTIQEGIYFRSGERPADHWRLLVLEVASGVDAGALVAALGELWAMLDRLGQGVVRDLDVAGPGEPGVHVASGGLTSLLGFGARFFDPAAHTPALVQPSSRPDELVPLRPNAGPFNALRWAADGDAASAQGDLALQFIGDSELAVCRPIVETLKLVKDLGLPLAVRALFAGFHREDRRSWIDFHDGINNLRSEDRLKAIEFRLDDTPWLKGGTLMTFLKVGVDLAAWRVLPRAEQEAVVGRDKLTGCPIVEMAVDGSGALALRRQAGCPASGDLPRNLPSSFIDPAPVEGLAKLSHIHRANRNRGDQSQNANNRVFRQGYEFLEPGGPDGVRLGLNFVSFQRRLAAVRDILSLRDWMGDANFGGATQPRAGEPRPIELMRLLAGAFYAVPPRGDPFPGAGLFPSA